MTDFEYQSATNRTKKYEELCSKIESNECIIKALGSCHVTRVMLNNGESISLVGTQYPSEIRVEMSKSLLKYFVRENELLKISLATL